MKKTVSLLAFVIFSILNGIAQTDPYDLIGDTILFYHLEGDGDCFYNEEALINGKFSKKNRFEAIKGLTPHSSIELKWLLVDSLIYKDEEQLLRLVRLEDNLCFLLYLPKRKYVSKNSFLHNFLQANSDNDIFWYSIKCEKRSEYRQLIAELTTPPVLSQDTSLINNADDYNFIDYDISHYPIKIRFLKNKKDTLCLNYYQTRDLLNKRKKHENEVNAFNQLLLKYDVSLIDSARMALSKQSFWFNINMLGDYDRENPPAAICNNKRFSSTYSRPLDPKYRNHWPNMTRKVYSDAVFLGNTWSFFYGKLLDIRLMHTIIPPSFTSSYRDEKLQELTSKYQKLWGTYNYYFVIVPDESVTYSSDNGYKPKFEEIANDTVFIPFTTERLEFVMNEYRMADFMSQLQKVRQEKADRFFAHRKELYDEEVQLFGKKIADIVSKGEIRFGFTPEMCQYAYYGEPYQIKWYVPTPFGDAFIHYYYTRGVKLYFIEDELIGIQWHDDKPRFK